MGSFYKQQLNDWVSTLDVKAQVVWDIGGAQHPIKGRTKSWDVEDYYIVDLKVPHVELQKPDIVHDMNDVWTGDGNYIDLIFMLGVMDYVINPNIAMENIYKFLKPGGIAWVEFPFIYCIHNPKDDEGCRYSEGCVRRLAKQANLEIEDMVYKRAKPGNTKLIEFYIEDGMRMADGVDHNITGYIVKLRKA